MGFVSFVEFSELVGALGTQALRDFGESSQDHAKHKSTCLRLLLGTLLSRTK